MRANRKVDFRPILEFNEYEIWQIIEENNLPINPLYDTYGRVGCMFCPYKNRKEMIYAAKTYPKYFKLLLRTIQRIMNNKNYMSDFKNATPFTVFLWWISNQPAEKFFNQTSLFEHPQSLQDLF